LFPQPGAFDEEALAVIVSEAESVDINPVRAELAAETTSCLKRHEMPPESES